MMNKRIQTNLKSTNSSTLETKVSFEVLSNFTNKSLERQLADQQLSRLLVTPDFSEGDGTGPGTQEKLNYTQDIGSIRTSTKGDFSLPVTVRFLDSSGGWGTLTCSLGGQLLTRSLSSRGFTGSLLSTCHRDSNL